MPAPKFVEMNFTKRNRARDQILKILPLNLKNIAILYSYIESIYTIPHSETTQEQRDRTREQLPVLLEEIKDLYHQIELKVRKITELFCGQY